VPASAPAAWRDPVAWREPVVWLYLVVVAIGLVQTVVLPDAGRTAVAALPALLGAGAAWAATWQRVHEDDARGAGWLVGATGVLVVLGGAALTRFLLALPAGLRGDASFYEVKVQVTTPLGDHNTVGGLLLVGVVASTVLAQEDRRWWWGTAVTTLGIVATLSRGAAAVLLLIGVLSAVAGARRRVAAALTLAGALALGAVIGAAAALPDPEPTHAAEGVVGRSVTERFLLMERALELVVAEPVLGVGLGGFAADASDLPPPNVHAHNSVLHAGAEGGVLAAAAVFALSVLLVVRAWRLPHGWRREVTLVGGVALVLHAQIDVLGGVPAFEILLAVLLTLARGPRR
jgi:O-antigen ligase